MNWRPSLRVALILVCLVSFSFGALVAYSAVVNLVQIRNIGTIRAIGVEVYGDVGLTQILTEVTWGTLDPGNSKSFSAWVKNTGSDPQRLVLWTENWVPVAAQNSISLSWDYVDAWIAAGSSVKVVFTLSVDPAIEGVSSFSFDIWIKGVA